MVYARVSVLSYSYFSSLVSSPAASLLFHSNILSRSRASFSPPTRKLSVSSSLATPLNNSTSPHLVQEKEESIESSHKTNSNRWKPLCLYHTQGKCTKMDDPLHLNKFNHSFSSELRVNATEFEHLCPQNLDYFLVLDLEGRVEILEFPVVMIDAKTLDFVDSFHRFVRPTEMSERRINEYIEGKYGKLGVDRVWHDTAIPFKEVLQQFEIWITSHHLWKEVLGGSLNRAAFVTCGNWDLKTKVPQQCSVASLKTPKYFMEWINLKDIYLNFYKRRATGMITMMKELRIPLVGSHHLGIDDTKNIARVLQRMLADGALLQITARSSKVPGDVQFLFKNRIR